MPYQQQRAIGFKAEPRGHALTELSQGRSRPALQFCRNQPSSLPVVALVGLLQIVKRGTCLQQLQIAQKCRREFPLRDDAPIDTAYGPVAPFDLQLLDGPAFASSEDGLIVRAMVVVFPPRSKSITKSVV